MENKFSCMGDGVSAPLNKLRSFKLNLDRMSNFERSLYGLFLHVDGEMEGVPKNVTKVQHYIPQEYLKAWCQTDSKQIAYREKSDAPMMRSYETVAYEKYGYKFQDLSYDEIELLMRGAFDESFGHIALMKHLVGTLVFPGLIRRLVEKDSFDDACKSLHFLCDLNALRPKQLEVANEILTSGKSSDMMRRLKLTEKNGFERYLAYVENSFSALLAALRRGDADFLEDKNSRFLFYLFFSLQLVRTPRFLLPFDHMASIATQKKIFEYLRFILALKFQDKFMQWHDSGTVRIIANDTRMKFVTGDQPVLNISSKKEDLWLYYPIGPSMAILIISNGSKCTEKFDLFKNIEPETVDWLNSMLCKNCSEIIIGNSADQIRGANYFAGMDKRGSLVSCSILSKLLKG